MIWLQRSHTNQSKGLDWAFTTTFTTLPRWQRGQCAWRALEKGTGGVVDFGNETTEAAVFITGTSPLH